jgi:hypothetical protein
MTALSPILTRTGTRYRWTCPGCKTTNHTPATDDHGLCYACAHYVVFLPAANHTQHKRKEAEEHGKSVNTHSRANVAATASLHNTTPEGVPSGASAAGGNS